MTAHSLKKALILTGTVSALSMILTLPSLVGAQPAANPPGGNVDATFNSVAISDGVDDNFVVNSDGTIANPGNSTNGGGVLVDDLFGISVDNPFPIGPNPIVFQFLPIGFVSNTGIILDLNSYAQAGIQGGMTLNNVGPGGLTVNAFANPSALKSGGVVINTDNGGLIVNATTNGGIGINSNTGGIIMNTKGGISNVRLFAPVIIQDDLQIEGKLTAYSFGKYYDLDEMHASSSLGTLRYASFSKSCDAGGHLINCGVETNNDYATTADVYSIGNTCYVSAANKSSLSFNLTAHIQCFDPT